MRRIIVLVLLGLGPWVWGQARSPMLLAKIEGKQQAMTLAKVEVQVQILGAIAETAMTMTFQNPLNRELAGTLYFPLPEGSTVSGYALDINGVLVDGVIVEKHKGRQVFEKIMRRGVDPGLVEWTKGNNFKTRVYPIPARGTRTIMVKYTSDVDGDKFRLPLHFKEKVGSFRLLVKVLRSDKPPKTAGGPLAALKFHKWGRGYFAKAALRDARLDEDLVLELEAAPKENVLVEQAADGNYYFVIHDTPQVPKPAARAFRGYGHMVIYWDASGSRASGKIDREIELYKSLEEAWGKLKTSGTKTAVGRVDLVVFRNAIVDRKKFVIKNFAADELLQALKNIQYDGATQMGCITPDPKAPIPECYLLFSDGLSNFGKEEAKGFKAPVYAISAASSANPYYLRELALRTGGAYFNLNRVKPEEAARKIGTSQFCYISPGVPAGKVVVETYPRLPEPVQGRFTLAGMLLGNEAKVTLQYGVAGKVMQRKTVLISRKMAVKSDLLRRYWAQKKVNDLLVNQKKHEKEIVAVGKEYGLVTPFTSLIVLESLSQYLEFHIPPPKSLPKMRKRYELAMANRQKYEQESEKKDLDWIAALWDQRLEWWVRFETGKDLFQDPARKANWMLAKAKRAIAEKHYSQAISALAAAEGALKKLPKPDKKKLAQISKYQRKSHSLYGQELLDEAKKLMGEKKYDRAISILSTAEKIFKKLPKPEKEKLEQISEWRLRSYSLHGQELFDEAKKLMGEKKYDRAIRVLSAAEQTLKKLPKPDKEKLEQVRKCQLKTYSLYGKKLLADWQKLVEQERHAQALGALSTAEDMFKNLPELKKQKLAQIGKYRLKTYGLYGDKLIADWEKLVEQKRYRDALGALSQAEQMFKKLPQPDKEKLAQISKYRLMSYPFYGQELFDKAKKLMAEKRYDHAMEVLSAAEKTFKTLPTPDKEKLEQIGKCRSEINVLRGKKLLGEGKELITKKRFHEAIKKLTEAAKLYKAAAKRNAEYELQAAALRKELATGGLQLAQQTWNQGKAKLKDKKYREAVTKLARARELFVALSSEIPDSRAKVDAITATLTKARWQPAQDTWDEGKAKLKEKRLPEAIKKLTQAEAMFKIAVQRGVKVQAELAAVRKELLKARLQQAQHTWDEGKARLKEKKLREAVSKLTQAEAHFKVLLSKEPKVRENTAAIKAELAKVYPQWARVLLAQAKEDIGKGRFNAAAHRLTKAVEYNKTLKSQAGKLHRKLGRAKARAERAFKKWLKKASADERAQIPMMFAEIDRQRQRLAVLKAEIGGAPEKVAKGGGAFRIGPKGQIIEIPEDVPRPVTGTGAERAEELRHRVELLEKIVEAHTKTLHKYKEKLTNAMEDIERWQTVVDSQKNKIESYKRKIAKLEHRFSASTGDRDIGTLTTPLMIEARDLIPSDITGTSTGMIEKLADAEEMIEKLTTIADAQKNKIDSQTRRVAQLEHRIVRLSGASRAAVITHAEAAPEGEAEEEDAPRVTIEARFVEVPGEGFGLPRREIGGRSGNERAVAARAEARSKAAEPGIAIKKWDPKTPYLAALKGAKPERRFGVYMAQKREYGNSPAFYLDCADFFYEQKQPALALQVLSNIAELELENAALLRILAHRLTQAGQLDLAIMVFEEVLRLRPEEPQSYRDLALVLARRGRVDDRRRAVELLAKVVSKKWDRFAEIELIALTELNNIFGNYADWPLDKGLQKVIPHDIRIVMTWDADMTDIDLWVTEPSGEKVFYSHNRSKIGGHMSRDFTQGYGPEEYCLRKAMHGMYKIQANYFGSRSTTLSGTVTLQVDIFTNYGRGNEKHRAITRRLKTTKEVVTLGEIEF